MTKCILITLFGDDKRRFASAEASIAHIRKFTDLPIELITDCNVKLDANVNIVETMWKGHLRYGYRNSDYWRLRAMLDLDYDSYCYLDADMRIVTRDFVQGFDLAEIFGFCIAVNPRSFVGIDSGFGEDKMQTYNGEHFYATSYSTSPIFTYPKKSKEYIQNCLDEFIKNPCRLPSIMAHVALGTGFCPYLLSTEWYLTERRPLDVIFDKPEYRPNPVMINASSQDMKKYYTEIQEGK